MSGILKGMRVVEGSAFVAVPLAGMTLAQMGADVIRFDRLEGGLDAKRWPVTEDGKSLFWAGLNKGKRSIAIDMKSERGRELVTQIVTAPGDNAGMFLTNLRVRGWMDYEHLSAHREDLIMMTLLGDRHGRPQVDYTVNPAVGFPMATGPAGLETPVGHALPAWDCIAGNLCVIGLLAAERQRLLTGQGESVEVTLKDVAAAMLGNLGIIGEVKINGTDRGRCGNSLYGAYAQDFVCRDGNRVMVIGLTDRQWRGLVKATDTADQITALEEALGHSLNEEGARWHARDAITEVFKPWFAERAITEFGATFDKAGITWSEYRSFKGAVENDPDLSIDNPMFSEIEQPGIGRYPVPGAPLSFEHHKRVPPEPAPLLGANTEEILSNVVRLPAHEIASLFDDGVVAGS
jgi:2-methylfumaryl-CoA isomerase